MLEFEPLCWIYHDTWKWKQTKIVISPNGDVQDLSKTYTHPGHIHLFFDGKDVSKTVSTKAYTGTQEYTFQVQDVWGPNSQDPNQIQSFRMIGSPIWYLYVEQYWRRMYVQSWDYDTDLINGIHDGKGGIKYDASKPQHTLGPFREGAQMFFFNTKVNRTLPIEYYLNEKKSARQLYVKDSSNSNDTSGGQIWHFSRQGELYNWKGDIWIDTDDYQSEDVSSVNDERHNPYWDNGRYIGSKKTSRIYSGDEEKFNGMNAKRIHKDGQNLLSSKDIYWQAYSGVFDDTRWFKFMTGNKTQWDALTHFYNQNEWEAWKNAFENWQKNRLSYRVKIDYQNALVSDFDDGYIKVDDIAFSNSYSYDIKWHIDSNSLIVIDDNTSDSWYKIIGQNWQYPKYRYSTPTPLPQNFQSEYSTSFDNKWLGYYEYYEVVKYKNKYYRRVWKPMNYNAYDFGQIRKDDDKIINLQMIDNVITQDILNQNVIDDVDINEKLTQYTLKRRRYFPNPPPDGLPYDGNPQHDMYWEYMHYFGKDNSINEHYGYIAPPINLNTLEYDASNTNPSRIWYEPYRELWGIIKYHKINLSQYSRQQIDEWKETQGVNNSDSISIPYAYWNENDKSACFDNYLNILHQPLREIELNECINKNDSGFHYFKDLYHIRSDVGNGPYSRWIAVDKNYHDNAVVSITDYVVVQDAAIPTYLQFHEFCNIWQELSDNEVSRLNLDGDMPNPLSNTSTSDIKSCFNFNNPLDPYTLSNSAITAWLKKYNRRQIYTIPEDTYCKGDYDISKNLHPYYLSYSEEDGARRYYPDDKFISPIIEYQKIIHHNWTLYNPDSYDILHDTDDVPKWKYCEPQALNTDPSSINISIPFVDIKGNVMSPFSENRNSPTLPIGQYSSHGEKLISPENKMRYHVQWFDSLAQVKKYNLPEYIRLITLWNNSFPEHQVKDDYISNIQPPVNVQNSNALSLQDWFYEQSTSTSPYFNNSIDTQGNIIHTPLIPVLRRNDEDTHVHFDIPFNYSHTSIQPNPDKQATSSNAFIEISNSYSTSYVYRSPTTQLCVTDAQVAKQNDGTYGYKDSSGKIRQGGNIVSFNDPYHKTDGKWFEQCLGAIVKAKAIIIFENGMGYRWYEQVTTTELQSDTPLRGLDY